MTGILENSSVYLSGPIESVDDGAGWRQRITPPLEEMGVRVYNPLVKPSWLNLASKTDGRRQKEQRKALLEGCSDEEYQAIFETQCEIRTLGVRLAHTCDWMICRVPQQFTVGTFEELTIAKQSSKPCLFWCPDGLPSMWLLAMFATDRPNSWKETFFRSQKALIGHIRKIHTCDMPIDPIQWIFATYSREANNAL